MEHPTDYTKTDTVVVTSDFTYEIDMIDPCYDSIFDDFSIANIDRSVKQDKIDRVLEEVPDSVSKTYGN